jgi:hypothetical protein
MSAPRLAASAVTLGIACAGCGAPAALEECPSMPVKGWSGLLAADAFKALSHRKERPYEPLSETSRLLWSDSSYGYERLLTFDLAHPRFASGASEERCIRTVSFMASTPLQGPRADTLAAFVAFLGAHGVPPAVVKSIEAARDRGSQFAPVGAAGAATVSAGTVVQGARGSFFRVEIGAAK